MSDPSGSMCNHVGVKEQDTEKVTFILIKPQAPIPLGEKPVVPEE